MFFTSTRVPYTPLVVASSRIRRSFGIDLVATREWVIEIHLTPNGSHPRNGQLHELPTRSLIS